MKEFTIQLLHRLSGNESGKIEGSLGQVVVLILLVIVIIGVIFVLLSLFFGKGSKDSSKGGTQFDRMTGVMGRLEKLEMTLNEFRTETLRAQEFANLEFRYMRTTLEEIRTLLEKNLLPGGGSGGEGGGRSGGQVPLGGPGKGSGESWDLAGQAGPEVSVQHFPPEPAAGRSADLGRPVWDSTAQDATISKAKSDKSCRMVQATEAPASLADRLEKTREGFFSRIRKFFKQKPELDQAALAELEELLVSCDLGIKTAAALVEELAGDAKTGQVLNVDALLEKLKAKMLSILGPEQPVNPYFFAKQKDHGPFVVLLVGVNGVGKTTTVVKLAQMWKDAGHKVLIAAADTFRAAAVEQLCQWVKKRDIPVVCGAEGAKPATVVFDAMQRAKQEGYGIVIIDTAGRLHTKVSLMQELEGVRNAVKRHQSDAPHETWLVIDGSTGQNAINQAREFNAALSLTGLIVTKLDGTQKGGVVVAIKSELGVPVRYIGVGESIYDLRPFVGQQFVNALFDSKYEGDLAQWPKTDLQHKSGSSTGVQWEV